MIIGAGPAGMTAAFELHRHGRAFTLLEKNTAVGGLARTLEHGVFRTDLGPHRFFSDDHDLYGLIEGLLGDRWAPGNRLSRFYARGKLYDFPRIKGGLAVAGPALASRLVLDFGLARIWNATGRKAPETFEELAIARFGRSLADLYILGFTEKFWGLPCSQISPDWAQERIYDISIRQMIKKRLSASSVSSRNLAARFYYPDTGIGLIFERMRELVSGDGPCIMTESYPVQIRHDGSRIREVDARVGPREQTFTPDHVLSSVPITEFLQMMDPAPPREVLEAAGNLRFRSHVSLFITLDRPSVFPDNWMYFPDREVPFARVMEPGNFSRKMAPDGKTSLLIEFFCQYGDELWNSGDRELFELSVTWLERVGFIKKSEVSDYRIINKERYAYPVYDTGYRHNKKTILDYLDRFDNLQLISRCGSFTYNNMDSAMGTGMSAARNIIDDKRYYVHESCRGRSEKAKAGRGVDQNEE